VVAVTGYDEASEVYREIDTFSSCNSVIGPFAAFPVPLEGDDVSDIIDRHREQLPMHEHMVTMDPPAHTRERALLMRLLTPKRLRDNEAFMWRLADRQLDEFVPDGRCEFISAYTQPFAMLVVADVLGVPESDHERFRDGFGLSATPGEIGAGEQAELGLNALAWLDEWFAQYIQDRRREPRNDVLTDLALATYPDGTTPDVTAVVRTASFLFAAGQETTARLLNGAANRDPRRFECPAEFRIDRANAQSHIAFGRGAHSCPGGPLARVEARVSVERILDRMRDIRLSEEHHGPPGARRFSYEPTWVLRGLSDLHLEFDPVEADR
jgi:cytochrome P450